MLGNAIQAMPGQLGTADFATAQHVAKRGQAVFVKHEKTVLLGLRALGPLCGRVIQ